jgi:hypothetical protein
MLTQNQFNNEVIKFRKQVLWDFLRSTRFDPFMGEDASSVIVRMNDLAGDGKEINVPLVNQLSGDGVGAGSLTGAEEILDSYGMPIWADWARNAVANNRATNKESSFSVRSTARSALSGWAKRVVRDDMVDALASLPTGAVQANRFSPPGNRVNGIKFGASTVANRNSWISANQDRVVFGKLLSNTSTVFATAAATLDTTDDKMTAAVGNLAKQLAQVSGSTIGGGYNGRPKINPWMIEELDEEMYVCFLGTRAFTNLQADTVMASANRDARSRENEPTKTNPIFTGGALLYNGILYKEIPEITTRLLVPGGASIGGGAVGNSVDMEPFFLCGQAALAYATGQLARPTTREDKDYDFIMGLGVEAQYGVAKVAKAPIAAGASPTIGTLVDWGMVTGWVAAPAAA